MKFALSSLEKKGFNWPLSLSLCMASKLSYSQLLAIEQTVIKSWGFLEFKFLEKNNTQCFVAQTNKFALIAFRGTESIGDWWVDLNFFQTKKSYGNVHTGFLNAYLVVHDEIRNLLAGSNKKKVWLTGHSLGGALATIAAAELKDIADIQGVFTFGQPRVGDHGFQKFMTSHLADNFFRFVNDDDIVTRVPPLPFEHIGQLIHFDANGNIKSSSAEMAMMPEEKPALSTAEFELIKEKIKKVQHNVTTYYSTSPAAIEFSPETVELTINASIEGIIPDISDHNIDHYIAKIKQFIPNEFIGLDIELDQQFRNSSVNRGTRGMSLTVEGAPLTVSSTEPSKIPVLVRTNTPNWQAPDNLEIHSQIGNYITAQASPDEIESLRKDPDIVAIEASRDAGIKELATSVPFIKGQDIHRPPLAEKGDAALVGIIDTGIDILHEAFLDEVGNSRILAIWDQLDNKGPSPKAVDNAFTQNYGSLYVADNIDALINGNSTLVPKALRDPDIHGTHVTSIATGRAIPGVMGEGMAPEAKIVVVIPKITSSPNDPMSIGYSKSHVDALAFLKTLSSGKSNILNNPMPMAVNVSLGMNAGAHDGLSLLEAAFDGSTNNGREAGFVIVKSAGNERGHGGHTRIRAALGLSTIKWNSQGFRQQDYFEAWYSGKDTLEFVLVDPTGNKSALVSKEQSNVDVNLNGNICALKLIHHHTDNGENCLAIRITPDANNIQEGKWCLEVIGVEFKSGDGILDMWIERDNSRPVVFEADSPEITLSIPGTSKSVITVGASNSSIPIQLTESSSFGRTRDNRPKPDIIAPGTGIIAAYANQRLPDGMPDREAVIALTGTSMAAPHVTGALALLMSMRHKQPAKEQYNANQLISALTTSADHSLGFHHEGFGWGVINVEKLLNELDS